MSNRLHPFASLLFFLSTIHHSSFIFVICKFYSSSSMHPVVRLSFICQQFIVRLSIFFTNHFLSFNQPVCTLLFVYIIVINTILINQCAPFFLYTSSSFIQSLSTSVHPSTFIHYTSYNLYNTYYLSFKCFINIYRHPYVLSQFLCNSFFVIHSSSFTITFLL